ncbi:MAG: hypothetical protein JXC31_06380 [Acholeplasmataceae bacterium]|nr:hypothetical protein [Acholeplasmataceae bacterium]
MKKNMFCAFLICTITYVYGQEYAISWTQTLMEPVGNDMEIIETSDGYYMFTGTAYNGTSDIVISKIDQSGNFIWAKYYGGSFSDESGNAIIEVHNNNYLVIGSYQTDLWILKVNSNGDTLWTKTIGETGITEKGIDITDYDENSFIITGSKFDPGDGNGSELWLVKIDSIGNLIWQKSYGTPSGSDNGVVVQNTNDGGIIIGGNKFNPDNASWQEAWIIKTDANGDSLWSRKFLDSSFDVGSPVIITESDEIISLYNNYYPGHGDVALIKLNANGDNIWSKYIYNQYTGYSLALNDNKLLLGGRVNSSGFVFIADSLGDSLWSDIYSELNGCYSLIGTSDSSIILLGTKDGFFTLIKLISTDLDVNFYADETLGPLPFTGRFTDSSSIYVNSWQWDFENDGIVDSYEKNPNWTYFDADTYSVKLIVSNEFVSDTSFKEDYIVTYFDSIPNLYSIEDIPDDQGGWVKVSFARSVYDTDTLVLAKTASLELYTVEINDGSSWMAAASTVAYGKSFYNVLVPTTKDSTFKSDGVINFRVIAGMEEGNLASNIVTGYSVDNLYPSIPQNVTVTITQEDYLKLTWSPVNDNDFQYYQVYRSEDGVTFEILDNVVDTLYVDNNIEFNTDYYYALCSVDYSGNQSDYSKIINLKVVGIEDDVLEPSQYFLSPNHPNPFNPITTFSYQLPIESHVKLSIFDINGFLVDKLIDKIQPSGYYSIRWTANNFSSGVYFYQLQAGTYINIGKCLLIK